MERSMLLYTSRLILRELREDDLAALAAYMADPIVTDHLCHGPLTPEACRNYLAAAIDQRSAPDRATYHLAIARPPGEELIGSCQLAITSATHREGSLGYILNRHSWGLGYGGEAARALLAAGFGTLGLHRITAQCNPANLRSIRVLEKLGMRYEGRLRQHKWCKGAWRDSNLYAVLSDEWV
ncbi:MAG TPA: GNAT family protein [Herpetosiphonaceae bacterium]|nr:GNAT family protein [Herpetosiphonaceae bacterium]